MSGVSNDPNTSSDPANRGESADLADFLASKTEYKVSSAQADLSQYGATGETPDLTEADEKPSNWQTAWSVLREVGETIILTLIIFFLIQLVIKNFRVDGTSMADNLHNGQYLIIDKLSYYPWVTEYIGIGGPHRGDVVVFEPPNLPGTDYVKRVIAVEGEKVEIIQGEVFVNDEPLSEPFMPRRGNYTMPPRVVPEGEVFVLGDNRNNSNDSHNWGTLPIDNIVGRAWISYWPPDLWGVIPRNAPTEEATLTHWFSNLITDEASAESESNP